MKTLNGTLQQLIYKLSKYIFLTERFKHTNFYQLLHCLPLRIKKPIPLPSIIRLQIFLPVKVYRSNSAQNCYFNANRLPPAFPRSYSNEKHSGRALNQVRLPGRTWNEEPRVRGHWDRTHRRRGDPSPLVGAPKLPGPGAGTSSNKSRIWPVIKGTELPGLADAR